MTPIRVTIRVDPQGRATFQLPDDALRQGPSCFEAVVTIIEPVGLSIDAWLPPLEGVRLVPPEQGGLKTFNREELYGEQDRTS